MKLGPDASQALAGAAVVALIAIIFVGLILGVVTFMKYIF